MSKSSKTSSPHAPVAYCLAYGDKTDPSVLTDFLNSHETPPPILNFSGQKFETTDLEVPPVIVDQPSMACVDVESGRKTECFWSNLNPSKAVERTVDIANDLQNHFGRPMITDQTELKWFTLSDTVEYTVNKQIKHKPVVTSVSATYRAKFGVAIA